MPVDDRVDRPVRETTSGGCSPGAAASALLAHRRQHILTPTRVGWMPTDQALVPSSRDAQRPSTAGHTVLGEGDTSTSARRLGKSTRGRWRSSSTAAARSTILCAGTRITVGPLHSSGEPRNAQRRFNPSTPARPHRQPPARRPPSLPLDAVTLPGGVAHQQGLPGTRPAPRGIQVSEGTGHLQGATTHGDGQPIGCGDGSLIDRPSGRRRPVPPKTPSPTETPTPRRQRRPRPDRNPRPDRPAKDHQQATHHDDESARPRNPRNPTTRPLLVGRKARRRHGLPVPRAAMQSKLRIFISGGIPRQGRR